VAWSHRLHLDIGLSKFMTFNRLEIDYLSFRAWVRGCVLPSLICLITALLLLRLIVTSQQVLNQGGLILAFFTVYYFLIRGGHILMIRSLHFDLKRRFESSYAEHLAYLPHSLRGYNIGFTLARIKRELVGIKPKL